MFATFMKFKNILKNVCKIFLFVHDYKFFYATMWYINIPVKPIRLNLMLY